MNNSTVHTPSLAEAFVKGIIEKCKNDTGFAAKLRKANNPDTEYQSWEILAGYGINLVHDSKRLPYATIGAAVAKSKPATNGSLNLGRAIAGCYDDGNQSDQAKMKLRRLLACRELPEACRILRALFSLIESRNNEPLDYTKILKQLLRFHLNRKEIKTKWAQEFYYGAITQKEEK